MKPETHAKEKIVHCPLKKTPNVANCRRRPFAVLMKAFLFLMVRHLEFSYIIRSPLEYLHSRSSRAGPFKMNYHTAQQERIVKKMFFPRPPF